MQSVSPDGGFQPAYQDDCLYVAAFGHTREDISNIVIQAPCAYNIFGITVGMNLEDAINLANGLDGYELNEQDDSHVLFWKGYGQGTYGGEYLRLDISGQYVSKISYSFWFT